MKKIITTCLSLIMLLTVFSDSALSQQKLKKDKKEDELSFNDQNRVPGTWDAVTKDNEVNIDFYGKHWSSGRMFMLSELGTLPSAGKAGEFSISREAGKLILNGSFDNHWGHGSYKFEENTVFKSYLEQKGFKELDDELMLDVFFTDINKAYFEYLESNGYANITNSEFRDLAQQDLNRKVLGDYLDLFKTEGYGHQSIDKIVELREHGVNVRFINSFYQLGYKNISLDKALELRDHGVSPDFINSFTKMGYKDITLDKAIDLRDHGVNPDFINNIQKMGYKDVTLNRAQDLKDHGVSPDFIKGIQALGFKDLSLDKAQELKDHGVSIAYIQKIKEKGLSNVHTLDDYIRLRDTGF